MSIDVDSRELSCVYPGGVSTNPGCAISCRVSNVGGVVGWVADVVFNGWGLRVWNGVVCFSKRDQPLYGAGFVQARLATSFQAKLATAQTCGRLAHIGASTERETWI